MEFETLIGLALAAAFIAANAFFVLAEFAIVKVRASRVQELAASGNPLAPILARRILPQLDAYLSVTQIGITVASLALGWIGEPTTESVLRGTIRLFGGGDLEIPHAVTFGIGFFLLTLAHVVLGELVPKTIAIQKAETMALWCARPLQFFYGFFYPLLVAFNAISNAILSPFGMRARSEVESTYTAQELRLLLTSSKERGILDPQLFAIIENAFNFRARTVREVMVPRDRVVVMNLSKSWRENRDTVRRYRHTRYPLVQTGVDDPVGIVHLKDVMLRTFTAPKEPDIRKFRREVHELAPDTRLDRALAFLRARSAHMAIVRKPEGAVEGIVCLEDIVETIVGTLEDEFDREERTSLAEILDPKLVDLVSDLPDKASLLRRGIALARLVKPELDEAATLAAIEQREALFSTGIGGGIAIPHAILEDLDRPLLVLLRPKKPVDYGAIDLKPVRFAFFFLLPATNPGLRLRFFSEIAGLLQKPGAQERLLAAAGTDKLVEVVRTGLN